MDAYRGMDTYSGMEPSAGQIAKQRPMTEADKEPPKPLRPVMEEIQSRLQDLLSYLQNIEIMTIDTTSRLFGAAPTAEKKVEHPMPPQAVVGEIHCLIDKINVRAGSISTEVNRLARL